MKNKALKIIFCSTLSFSLGIFVNKVINRINHKTSKLGCLCIEDNNKKVTNLYVQLNEQPEELLKCDKVIFDVAKLDISKSHK